MSLSGSGRRRKGVRGEREVRDAFEREGFEVRGLEASGDHLVARAPDAGQFLHVEVKRQERIQVERWSLQAEAEAPAGCVPLVVYRRSQQPWRVSLRLSEFIDLLR